MSNASQRPSVLFLCTGNSCRSQMAEGWTKALKSQSIDAYSAGTNPHVLNPLAVKAMALAGVAAIPIIQSWIRAHQVASPQIEEKQQ